MKLRHICHFLAFALVAPSTLLATDDYQLGPDSKPNDGAPHGVVT